MGAWLLALVQHLLLLTPASLNSDFDLKVNVRIAVSNFKPVLFLISFTLVNFKLHE